MILKMLRRDFLLTRQAALSQPGRSAQYRRALRRQRPRHAFPSAYAANPICSPWRARAQGQRLQDRLPGSGASDRRIFGAAVQFRHDACGSPRPPRRGSARQPAARGGDLSNAPAIRGQTEIPPGSGQRGDRKRRVDIRRTRGHRVPAARSSRDACAGSRKSFSIPGQRCEIRFQS
jgi:hypothetical protein